MYMEGRSDHAMQCYICFEGDKEEACDVVCKGHQFHLSCLESWIRSKKSPNLRSCPVCQAKLNFQPSIVPPNSLLRAIIDDDPHKFRTIQRGQKSDRSYSNSQIVQLAIEHSAWTILKDMKPLDSFWGTTSENQYLEFVNNPTLGSVRWLLGDFEFPEGSVPGKEGLIDLLIDRLRFLEIYRIYRYCFRILTLNQKILAGLLLSHRLVLESIPGIVKDPAHLFHAIYWENPDLGRYILTIIYPICLNKSIQALNICQNCGSIHTVEAILGAIRWRNLYYLNHLLKCCIDNGFTDFKEHYKSIVSALNASPLRQELVEIFNGYPQFSNSLAWKFRVKFSSRRNYN